MYDNKEPVHDNISNSETQQYTPTYKPWVWYGMYHIKQQDTTTRGLGCLALVKKLSEESLT